MKILLTIVVCGEADKATSAPLYDGIELIYPEAGEPEKDYLARAVKGAKGKYAVICDKPFKLSDVQSLLNIIDKNNSDMVCFAGGAAFKVAVLRNSVKGCTDSFSCAVLAVLGCKTFLKTLYTPFTFEKACVKFHDDNSAGLLISAEEFGKVKSKIHKELYTYASNMICDRLVLYYTYAILAIKDGDMPADKLLAFDGKLKAEIVLYLSLEKRFTAAKLHKLRDKNFKISGLKAKKFRKLLQ